MTSAEIRQSFLYFFESKGHTIVPSSSLRPDSPNLLFTNAGMNQFVPIFLGQRAPDVDKWPGAIPGLPTRAADTQKCIRAGGKQNDLEDVGLDTYHHTFFEMLGNWSFGDYFKKEAIEWAWELLVGKWKLPPSRLYATVYKPGPGDPAGFDQEAYDHWARLFAAAGLDPAVHIVSGDRKDNFWMMGETGPCGPCSEIHVDLTPQGQSQGALVNAGSPACIEIWNLVFIQFNANPDGTFTPLPGRHVDTGMGLERVTAILQCTRNLTDFSRTVSNYETDIFRPLFDKLEQLSGKKYASTLPPADLSTINPQQSTDIAFRVIADHIRTLGFAIADGIHPGNTDRKYVLRRILRRAVRYGRSLGFHEPFLYRLVDVLAATMGHVFPEIREKRQQVQGVIQREEEAFNQTLDRGIELFDSSVLELNSLKKFLQGVPSSLAKVRKELDSIPDSYPIPTEFPESVWACFIAEVANRPLHNEFLKSIQEELQKRSANAVLAKFVTLNWHRQWKLLCEPATRQFKSLQDSGGSPETFEPCRTKLREELQLLEARLPVFCSALELFPGDVAFKLHDTYGFPLDLTELMAREHGLAVDVQGFNQLMAEQRALAKGAQKRVVIEVAAVATAGASAATGTSSLSELPATKFIGYDRLETPARVLEVVSLKDKNAVVLDTSVCYPEMGGQVGDTGALLLTADVSPLPTSPDAKESALSSRSSPRWKVVDTQRSGDRWMHLLERGLSGGGEQRGSLSSDSSELGFDAPVVGSTVTLRVDRRRREAIQRHHTVTHLLHWALHEVVSKGVSQKGSYVSPDKLTFDFDSAPLTPQQVADIEKLVNERILENAGVSWTEVPYAEVKNRRDVMQFFGDKYGDTVRVVQIGGHARQLDGYSMELCGGTHTRAAGEIGLFRIVGENAIAAGIRRIEALAGLEAYRKATEELQLIKTLAGKVNSPVHELERKIESLLEHQKELERRARIAMQRNASNAASELLGRAQTVNGIPLITHNLGDADAEFLQAIADALKGRFQGVVILGGGSNNAVSLVATVSSEFTAKVQAGRIIQSIAPIVGGKGGGRPDNARGGGREASKLDEALAEAKKLLEGTGTLFSV